MSKEVFGEEIWTQMEAIIKSKGINLIVDNKEKPEYIPKSRFDEVISQKNLIKSQADELTQQLGTLSAAAKGNDELTKQIEGLQKTNGDWESKYNTSLLDSAIKLKATVEKARDPSDLIKFLDTSKLEIKDGAISGLDEQLVTLKQSKAYLFDSVGGIPPNPPNNRSTALEELQLDYEKAIVSKNLPAQIALKNMIFKENTKKQGD